VSIDYIRRYYEVPARVGGRVSTEIKEETA